MRVQGTARIDTQGSLTQTGNSFDMALDGDGYFQVQLPGGKLGYTRAGNFTRSPEGLLVTCGRLSGDARHHRAGQRHLRSRSAPTAPSPRRCRARPRAPTSARSRSRASPTPPACSRPATITSSETASSGAANLGIAGQDGRGNIRQGRLEASNVNVVEELVDMIETQRAYEVNSKMISATDDMLKYVNQNL